MDMELFSVVGSAVAIMGIVKKIQPEEETDDKILELESLIKGIVTDFSTINRDQIKKELRHKKMIKSVDKVVGDIIDVALKLKDISAEIKNGH